MVQYSIMQMVRRVDRNTREEVQSFGADYLRSAKMRFEELKRSYPDEYFELLKIEHTEECLDFTQLKMVNV